MAEKKPIIRLDKGKIFILSGCCKELLATTDGQELQRDGRLAIEAGTAKCKFCKKDVAFPEVQAKVFEEETPAAPPEGQA